MSVAPASLRGTSHAGDNDAPRSTHCAQRQLRSLAIALLDTYDSPLSVPFYERHLGYSRRALRLRKAFR